MDKSLRMKLLIVSILIFFSSLVIGLSLYSGLQMSAAAPEDEIQVKMTVEVRKGSKVIEYKVEAVPGSFADLGKSPHWVNETQSLYLVDFDGRLLRFDYGENRIYTCKLPHEGLPCFIIPVEGSKDKFAIGLQRKVIIVIWDGKSDSCNVERTLFEVETEPQFKDNRMNVGKCDSRGRLFAGTMLAVGDEFINKRGSLYKYDKGQVEQVQNEVGISNGMAFDDALKKLYFIDTGSYNVREYDYDVEKGVASKPSVILDLHTTDTREHLKLPDGMTIDSEGNLYVTLFNTGTIYKYDPRTRKILMEIKLPCKQLTSAAFGGPNLDILYVATSARFDEPRPAGYLFKITGLESKGLPQPKIRL